MKQLFGVFMAVGFVAVGAKAQVPADIEAGLVKMGHIVDPPCTAKLYRPLMPANDITSSATSLYPGITVVRNASFGPNPKDVVDIFTADKGAASRPVLIYVPGGGGNKIELQDKEANAFYDNIMRWATKNGMVGVNMQRHGGQGWDAGAKDISAMIQWVQTNIAKYHGNPDRMFIWAHSAGNNPLGTYIGRPELYGPKGVGVKGVIFMSPAAFDIAPLEVPPPPAGAGNPFAALTDSGKTCGVQGGAFSSSRRASWKNAGAAGWTRRGIYSSSWWSTSGRCGWTAGRRTAGGLWWSSSGCRDAVGAIESSGIEEDIGENHSGQRRVGSGSGRERYHAFQPGLAR